MHSTKAGEHRLIAHSADIPEGLVERFKADILATIQKLEND